MKLLKLQKKLLHCRFILPRFEETVMFVLTDRKILRSEITLVQFTYKVDAKHFLSRII